MSEEYFSPAYYYDESYPRDVSAYERIHEIFATMRKIAVGPESTLTDIIDNSVGNYDLYSLVRRDKVEFGLVRAARFADGVFYSTAVDSPKHMIQLNLEFKDTRRNPDAPHLTSWKIIKRRNAWERHIVRDIPLFAHEIYTSEMQPVFEEALSAVTKESRTEPPWQNSYSRDELRSVRTGRMLKNITDSKYF